MVLGLPGNLAATKVADLMRCLDCLGVEGELCSHVPRWC